MDCFPVPKALHMRTLRTAWKSILAAANSSCGNDLVKLKAVKYRSNLKTKNKKTTKIDLVVFHDQPKYLLVTVVLMVIHVFRVMV